VKGAALAIRREAFEAIGGFDESFFMYFEDADLCYRLQAAGWEVHFTPAATLVHVGGASTAQYRTDMAAQQLASTLQLYHRHSSRICLGVVVVILKILMLAKWICGTLALYLTRNSTTRKKIVDDLAAWRRVLTSQRVPMDMRIKDDGKNASS
jgi:GT2 family glycosyltransferase